MPTMPRPTISRPRSRHSATLVPALAAALLTALVAIGCGANNGTPAPTTTASASAPAPTATPGATPELTLLPTDPATTPVPTAPGQTSTAWGRIWDGLPSGFPGYPGAHPTITDGAPTSATLDAGSADPGAVVNAYKTALEAAGWMTIGLSGPMEDGSRQLTSVLFQSFCQIQTTATPLGGSTIITILYGADCPFRN